MEKQFVIRKLWKALPVLCAIVLFILFVVEKSKDVYDGRVIGTYECIAHVGSAAEPYMLTLGHESDYEIYAMSADDGIADQGQYEELDGPGLLFRSETNGSCYVLHEKDCMIIGTENGVSMFRKTSDAPTYIGPPQAEP